MFVPDRSELLRSVRRRLCTTSSGTPEKAGTVYPNDEVTRRRLAETFLKFDAVGNTPRGDSRD